VNKVVGIGFHGSPMEHKFLFMESILTEEEVIFNHQNLSALLECRVIFVKLIRKDERDFHLEETRNTVLCLSFLATSFTTISHLIPNAFQLFTPGKRSVTNRTDFLR
jgi:hypothetical protein